MYVCMHVCTCLHYACVGMYIHIYVFMYYYLFSVLSVTVSVIAIVNVLLQNALKLTVVVLKLVLEINNLNNFITFHILCLKSSVIINYLSKMGAKILFKFSSRCGFVLHAENGSKDFSSSTCK